ncbi:MAG: DNA mismatch repair endonuclease MutL [Eubacteriales bacterium]|jgi:DNA mismatch repair protein MutL|nr:DNA mismatch repair endonuclease MutL [Lachnospiraceae bacterium]MDD5859080.1 DNA mismatch repair endonuclease MutL [Eubacteriales bacterium]MCH4064626.1 DNA mismatch repair endonuclease MutL [Lachnospiraceae bacterium]MCH4104857.1 DNA mismatch repair endonuclease MutL [Lachnospiraceae bacterium]MCI1309758.1 DNA mismatch repair endonuclease MutL [Lachnospiraceae bacterium]
MSEIHVLSQSTIDKIAAGEVVERPASVVKELTENSIDAGADRITIEIRDGGISMVRITDNGKGMAPDDLPLAFQSHATSKITTVNDLDTLSSLGFRGEALSSIAAVSRVEVLTKRPADLSGRRYVIEGGRPRVNEAVGTPDGTTVIVRDLFYNTPARAKFLKTAMTEAAHVGTFVEQLILSNPSISFRFLVGGQTKLESTGSGNLRDCIYHIYGREVVSELVETDYREDGIHIHGFIGKPSVSRGNRGFENYYVNGRYIESRVVARGIEDGYRNRLMQHQYPFVCLFLDIDGGAVDVNVHPRKLEVRFSDEKRIYQAVLNAVRQSFEHLDMVLLSSLNEPDKRERGKKTEADRLKAQPFETRAFTEENQRLREEAAPYVRKNSGSVQTKDFAQAKDCQNRQTAGSRPALSSKTAAPSGDVAPEAEAAPSGLSAGDTAAPEKSDTFKSATAPSEPSQAAGEQDAPEKTQDNMPASGGTCASRREGVPVQGTFLSAQAKPLRRIIGQVFNTYWICEFDGKMYIFDQHAAHERVNFERFMKQYKERKIAAQQVSPPIIFQADARQEMLLLNYKDSFAKIGFDIEPFGGRSFAVHSVPYTLGTIDSADLFRDFLSEIEVSDELADLDIFVHRVATEACKASVKGGEKLSFREAEALLDELMNCEDPYHCPHGRPTIIAFTRQDLEKRFKRIV